MFSFLQPDVSSAVFFQLTVHRPFFPFRPNCSTVVNDGSTTSLKGSLLNLIIAISSGTCFPIPFRNFIALAAASSFAENTPSIPRHFFKRLSVKFHDYVMYFLLSEVRVVLPFLNIRKYPDVIYLNWYYATVLSYISKG